MIATLILILLFLLLFIYINNFILNKKRRTKTKTMTMAKTETKYIEKFSTNLLPDSLQETIKDSDKVLNKDPVLYPIRGLQAICAKEGLKPSFMPKACYVGDILNSYANCKCEDSKGNCKICYPEIKKDSKNSNVVYDANVI